jgi:thymidylate synthase (FAD)
VKVTLEYITPDAENFIGKMAGICYDAVDDPERNIKRAAKCAQDGHLATLRFASAVFNISGISRVCSHQFVRSKHLDFLQRSQRYCKDIQAEVTQPKMTDEQEAEFFSAIISSQQAYEALLKLGMKKEDARFVLPEATHTEFNVVGNLQAWRDFIKLRADPHAQWEIREVAKQINNILAKECPNLFYWMN